MSGEQFDSVEALLEEARLTARMPEPAERLRLRQAAGLSRAQVAAAVGVGRQTVANWEDGSTDPQPPGRFKYLRLLEGLAQIHPVPVQNRTPAAEVTAPGVAPAAGSAVPETAWGSNGLAVQGEPAPCLRCGVATPYKATDGRSLHPGAMCQPPATTPQAVGSSAPVTTPSPAPAPAPVPSRPQRRAKSAARAQAETAGLIGQAVHEELERAQGDADAAVKALVKRAIPDVMRLFDETRATARYIYTAYPALPDILTKPSKKEPDQIWEARPNFHHPDYSLKSRGSIAVTALDVNAAYLSALKAWLPIGKLEHSTGMDGVDPKRSGVHLITPSPWHHPHLPDPLGDRDQPGPLWVTNATLRLLLRLATPKYRLLDPPVVHESWTSGATENFLDALRKTLTAAREAAIAEDDTITLEYIKAMYSKFISTMGESIHNREIMRPDWMHIIHSQAYANLGARHTRPTRPVWTSSP